MRAAIALGLALAAVTADAAAYKSSGFYKSQTADQSIYEAIGAQQNTSTFLRLVDEVGLTVVLNSTSPISVFAPSNAAFEELPAQVLEALQLPALVPFTRAIIEYHIAVANLTVAALPVNETTRVPTLLSKLEMSLVNTGNQTIIDDSATVVLGDQASNGQFNIIDRVLLPGGAFIPRDIPSVVSNWEQFLNLIPPQLRDALNPQM